MKIENHTIGNGRVFFIAEIGNNHNGSVSRAIEMVDLAGCRGRRGEISDAPLRSGVPAKDFGQGW